MGTLSYRRLFAWASLCCALSTLCGLHRLLVIGGFVCGVFCCPLIAHFLIRKSVASLSLKEVVLGLLLFSTPLLTFIYGGAFSDLVPTAYKRSHATISAHCRKRVLLVGLIEGKSVLPNSAAQVILINCERLAFPYEQSVSGRACLVVDDAGALRTSNVGDTLSATCYLRSMRFSKNNDPYLERYRRSADVFGFINSKDVRVECRFSKLNAESFPSTIFSCRDYITSQHTLTMGENAGALLTSMVLGQNAVDLPKKLTDDFRDVGLSHIIAASGFNLTVVIMVANLLLRPLNLPGYWREYICFFILAMYVALAGLSASMWRAAFMSIVLILSRMTQRRAPVKSVLAAALSVTWLPAPLALLDVGLQLSYAATFGITSGARLFAEWLNSGSNKILQKVANLAAVTLIAQIFVLPIQFFYFGTIGLAFLPANLLVVPGIEILTIAGFISSVLILVSASHPIVRFLASPIIGSLDFGLAHVLNGMTWIIEILSSFEWAKLKVHKPSASAIAIYYVCVAINLVLLKFPDKKLFAFLVMSGAIYCLLTQ